MFDRSRSTLRTAVCCGFLLLAFSVFAWGLNAKLALYHHDVAPSSATVAKLLTSQRTGRMLLVAPERTPSTQTRFAWMLSLSFVAALLLLPSVQARRLALVPLRRRALSPPLPASRFTRPPPARTRAR